MVHSFFAKLSVFLTCFDSIVCLNSEEELRVQLARLEKELLTQLATSQGNILENAPLISSLDQIKSESTNVAQKIANSKQVQAAVDEQREGNMHVLNFFFNSLV
jgi:hypothetical protein